MDGNVQRLLDEDNEDLKKIKEECLSLKLQSNEVEEKSKKSKRNMTELRKEEERLNAQLEKLQRENFELQVSINSYQVALTKKLAEFKEAELELNNLYKEIWQEREKFCAKADDFDQRRGLLSDWWKNQKSFVTDLEKLEEKRDESERRREEIKFLESEIQDYREAIDEVLNEKIKKSEIMVGLPEGGEPVSPRFDSTVNDLSASESETKVKKVRFEKDENYDGGDGPTEMSDEASSAELFSMMDMNKMKLLKGRINRLAKNKF